MSIVSEIQGQLAMKASLDRIVIGWMAHVARESVPHGDMEAAMSAFLSEIASSELADYFPELRPGP
jgi:hypothetical protein